MKSGITSTELLESLEWLTDPMPSFRHDFNVMIGVEAALWVGRCRERAVPFREECPLPKMHHGTKYLA